jgi:hypothetical protein
LIYELCRTRHQVLAVLLSARNSGVILEMAQRPASTMPPRKGNKTPASLETDIRCMLSTSVAYSTDVHPITKC